MKTFHLLSFLKDGKENEKKIESKNKNFEDGKKEKAKEITKKQKEELLQQSRKKGGEDFLKTFAEGSGIQGAITTLDRNNLHLMACDFKVYKDYKIELKFPFPICKVNNGTNCQRSTTVYHHLVIHYYIIPSQLLYCYPITYLMLLSSFEHSMHNALSSRRPLLDIKVRRGTFKSYACADNFIVKDIYLFLQP